MLCVRHSLDERVQLRRSKLMYARQDVWLDYPCRERTVNLPTRPTPSLMLRCVAVTLATLMVLSPAIAQEVEGTRPSAPGLQDADLPPILDREIFTGDPEVASAQLSPDGRFIAFRKPHDNVMNVWVKGRDEPFEDARLLTADDRPVVGYFWTEDGRYVLYVQDKGGDENFHVYAVDPTAAAEAEAGVPPARDLTPLEGIRAFIHAVPEARPGTIWVGLNDRDAAWHDLYRLDIATGKRTRVYENTDRITGFEFDLDGRPRLALRSAEDGSTEILPFREDGTVGDVIYSCTVQETCGTIRFHRDGDGVYMRTNSGDRDLTELVLLDPTTGEETFVERDPEGRVDFGGAAFSDMTDEIEITYYNGDRLRLYPKNDAVAADLDFLRSELPDGDVLPGSSTDDERTWLVTVTQATDPGSVYLFDRDARTVELLYRSRPDVPSEHMADMRAIRFTARDGMEIPAYLTIPKGTSGRNLPAIILPHGGPWARDGYGYSGLVQLFANRGYAVLQPNFRGSTGYGKAFLAAGDRGWGTGAMQHDLTDAARYLIDEGIADPERVGILGGSYGGYATLAGLAFTPDLYAAGVDIVGPSNLITLLETIPPYWAATRQLFYERMGNPETEEGRAQLEAQSPLHSADQIAAPLLIIQGANDPRVKQAESDQIVIALRDRGYPVEYMVAPDEGHGFRGEMNRLAMTVAIEQFLAEHLGGREQTSVDPAVRAHLDDLMVDPATVTYTPRPRT